MHPWVLRLWIPVRSKSSTKTRLIESTAALGLWVWQVTGNLSRRLRLPLQEFTHFEINLYNCFFVRFRSSLKAVSEFCRDRKNTRQEGWGSGILSGSLITDVSWSFGLWQGSGFTLRVYMRAALRHVLFIWRHIAKMEESAELIVAAMRNKK